MKHFTSLCAFLLAGLSPAFAAAASPAPAYVIYGHRGGVVEDKFPDNSAAALHGAVARGYAAIEVDIRETRDGVLVMQHDPDLRQNFGDPRKIIESTWAEIEPLVSKVADQHVWRFEDLVRTAHATGLRLMLDSKDPHTAGFPEKVEAILRKYDMLGRCCIIGTSDAMDHFTGLAPVGKKFKSLKPLLDANPAAKANYFLFDEGTTLTPEMVKWAQGLGVKVIPSINIYHYYDPATMAGKPRSVLAPIIFAAAHKHIEALKALGVTEFQIDSEFDRWF